MTQRKIAALACALVLLTGAGAFALEPAPGTFLVAREDLADARFAGAVVLLVEHGGAGSMGLVVNRPSRLNLSQLLPNLETGELVPDILFYGGPVENQKLSVLVRTSDPPDEAKRILEDVYLSGLGNYLLRVFGGGGEDADFRIYTGYAGWAQGQLEREVQRGDWLVVPASAEQVFTQEYETLWEQLRRSAPPLVVMIR